MEVVDDYISELRHIIHMLTYVTRSYSPVRARSASGPTFWFMLLYVVDSHVD
jgi:hypothetical protein